MGSDCSHSKLVSSILFVFSEDENVFLGSALEMYSIYGLTTVYIGGSDIGHDNQLTWWDQSSIEETFWAIQMPQYVEGLYIKKLNWVFCFFKFKIFIIFC